MDIATEITKSLATLLIALIAAFVGASIATRKHRKDKRWEARYIAYQDVLKAISDVHTWTEESYASVALLPSVSTARISELREQFHLARHLLWRYAKVGRLTLPSSSISSIEKLLSALENERFRFEDEGMDESTYDFEFMAHCEKLRSLLDTHTDNIIDCAERDLN